MAIAAIVHEYFYKRQPGGIILPIHFSGTLEEGTSSNDDDNLWVSLNDFNLKMDIFFIHDNDKKDLNKCLDRIDYTKQDIQNIYKVNVSNKSFDEVLYILNQENFKRIESDPEDAAFYSVWGSDSDDEDFAAYEEFISILEEKEALSEGAGRNELIRELKSGLEEMKEDNTMGMILKFYFDFF